MSNLKVAVLMNGFTSPNTPMIRDSFISALEAAASSIDSFETPTIDFYDPIVAQIHPDLSAYDLIVLSGGTVDPMGSDPWVLKLQTYLNTTVAEHPKQKIVGICWGHQTTSVSFGGKVGNMDGPEIGVHQITLTPEGKKMFPFAQDGKLNIHEFHRREIKSPAKGFVPLAEGSQSFINEANTIITFQGHPELNAALAKNFVETTPAYMGLDDEKKAGLVASAGLEHDGVKIWERILRWVKE
ncbi:class I glutamine amidotransferase-like protein [Mollisia scopiformis]|uniref:Class I glutamine amidotransferase-like protein n=1 Tax=Mollisia scopiformis TaxID=149040 RepID=A0A194X6M3_MOLSC|nr:class I glutamine amidotransferase-like protein [Mollisia scopiformis]KUJ15831.1 class I glutamine amidotransferase-like protein [Mollisia scopiformis]